MRATANPFGLFAVREAALDCRYNRCRLPDPNRGGAV